MLSGRLLTDLTPQGVRAGRELVSGLRTAVQGQQGALRADIVGSLIPTSLTADFGRLTGELQTSAATLTRALGAGGLDAGRALITGLAGGLEGARTVIQSFAQTTSGLLVRATLLGDLGPEGTRAGTQLVSGVTRAITSGAGEVQRAVSVALVPANLAGQLATITTSVAREVGRLTPLLGATGTLAGRSLVQSLGASLSAGTAVVVREFARGASGAVAGIDVFGDLTPAGQRAGTQLLSGLTQVVRREGTALSGTLATALIPTSVTGDIARLTNTVSTGLAVLPAVFATAGRDSGTAFTAALTSQLVATRGLLTTFARDASTAVTSALTIGDVSGAGERAGRALGGAIAGGVMTEAPRIRAALSTALVPATITADVARITGVVAAEAATLAPTLAIAGTQAGRAFVSAIQGEVVRGASVLRQLTAGAQVGVVVDAAQLRAARAEMEGLSAAATDTANAMRGVDAATDAIDARGLTDTTRATRTLADAQREWLREAQGGSVAAQALWQRQREAAFQAGTEASKNANRARRDADLEVAARRQVRAELVNDIAQLQQYGAQVDGTSRRARAAWIEEAAAIRRQASEVGLSRSEMARLDAVVDQVTASFREQERAARNAANQIRNAGSAAPRFGAGVVDLGSITRQASVASKAINTVTVAGRSMSQIMTRAAPALVGVGFGLEGIALGGDRAESGIRQVLRQVATFGTFFGPKGFIVAGIAATVNGVIALFEQSRDEMVATEKKFKEEIAEMVRTANTAGLQKRLQDIQIGTIEIDETGIARFKGGLLELQQQAATLKQQIRDAFSRGNLYGANGVSALTRQLEAMTPTLDQQQRSFNSIANLIRNFPQLPRDIVPTKPIVIESGAAIKAQTDLMRALSEQVGVVQEAFARVNGDAQLQAQIITKAIPLYDRVAGLAAEQKGAVTETANELARMLRTLGDIGAVQIELTRRKLGGVMPVIDKPILVTASIDRVTVPAATRITIPAEFDPRELSDGIRRAIDQLSGVQNQKIFARMFGTSQDVADATENVNIETANLARTFRAAADAILQSADADTVKAQRMGVLKAAAQSLRIEITGLTDDARDAGSTLAGIGDAAYAIASVGREIAGVDSEVLDAIDSVGRLAGALSDVSKIKLSGPDGLFSSFTNFLEGIPAVGELVASVVNAHRSIIGAISGKAVADANSAIVKENTEALTRLAQDLAGFGRSIGDLVGDSRAIQESAILSARRGSGFSRGFRDVEGLDAELRAAGSSIAELKRRAEELGITIVDAKGRISAQGLDALNTALKLAAYEAANFGRTLRDLQFIQDARREIFDVSGSQAVFDDVVEQIRQFAPELFKRFLGGIDVSSAEGRRQAEQAIRDLFDFITSSGIDLTPFLGGFESVEDFVNSIITADRALDDMAETTKAVVGEAVNLVKGFRDFNLERARFQATADDLRVIRAAIPTPNPTPIPVGAGGSGMTTVGQVTFAPTIRIDGRDKDAVQITTEVVTELRRRAKASPNPDVRRTVNLLPA
jgi:hypothetical protein